MTDASLLNLLNNKAVIDKSANLLGMLFPYAGIKKIALDVYVEEIRKSSLSPEAKVYAVLNAEKTIKHIANQKQIAEKAMCYAKEGTDFTKTSGVSEEWLERFMDSARFVSTEELQEIWGKILANEFETPKSTPPSMIRVLSEVTSEIAIAFRKICSMRVGVIPVSETGEADMTRGQLETCVPYHSNRDQLHDDGLSFNILNEMDSLGLIKFDAVKGYALSDVSRGKLLICANDTAMIVKENHVTSFPIGNVLLTSAGIALRAITPLDNISNYSDMVKEYYGEKGINMDETDEFRIEQEEGEITIHITD